MTKVWTWATIAVVTACGGSEFSSDVGLEATLDAGGPGSDGASSGGRPGEDASASTGGRGGSSSGSGGTAGSGGSSGTAGRGGSGGGTGGSGAAAGAGGAAGQGGTGGAAGQGGAGGSAGTAGAGGSSGAGGVAGMDAGSTDGGTVRCTGSDPTFPEFERGCSSADNCVLVLHTVDCCGTQLAMAINHSEVERFNSAEAACDAQYPACGCAGQGVRLEDGTVVDFASSDQIAAQCKDGTCSSRYAGDTFACGDRTCTDLQYCSIFTGGPAGSVPSYTCNYKGNLCNACSCVTVGAGCNCAITVEGDITVSCAAP